MLQVTWTISEMNIIVMSDGLLTLPLSSFLDCSGPNVMKGKLVAVLHEKNALHTDLIILFYAGYHNNPEATNEVVTLAPDGKSRL